MPTPSQKESLKRYELDSGCHDGEMQESPDGEYYLTSDVDAELARLRECEKALSDATFALEHSTQYLNAKFANKPTKGQKRLLEIQASARRALGGKEKG